MRSCPDPVLHRPPEEFFDRDPVRTYEKASVDLERRGESRLAWMCVARTTALDLDGREPAPCPRDKVHLSIAVPPVVQFAHPKRGGIRQVRPHRRLHQSPQNS